jgi:hypothetical protein
VFVFLPLSFIYLFLLVVDFIYILLLFGGFGVLDSGFPFFPLFYLATYPVNEKQVRLFSN